MPPLPDQHHAIHKTGCSGHHLLGSDRAIWHRHGAGANVWDVDRNGSIDSGAPTGANRTICIIDSGVYTGHEDLAGVNFLGGYPSGWNSDGFGHGTHVTGTITALNNSVGVVGVLPGTATVYMVRVFGDDGAWAYTSTLIDAANRCANAGANIISMSLGGSRSSITERRGFDSLYSKGILSIAAAGNDGTSAYSYPASYDSVMSVAALDSSETVASFSQYNNQVEIAAPGVGVLSTVPYLDESSLVVAGISYAVNHVEYSGRGTATGALVNGGICDTTGAWSGKVVLCARGTNDFYTKVMNVQNSGGTAALIYNNVPGGFLGTLGTGNSSTIIALSLSQEDGQFLVATSLALQPTSPARTPPLPAATKPGMALPWLHRMFPPWRPSSGVPNPPPPTWRCARRWIQRLLIWVPPVAMCTMDMVWCRQKQHLTCLPVGVAAVQARCMWLTWMGLPRW